MVLFMKTRIYLVENNPRLSQSLIEFIKEFGDAVVIGSSATESDACDWFDANETGWDVAVVDLLLDKGSGLQVIRRIRKASTQKVVVLTNYASSAMREFCINSGADRFFDKSTELDKFTQYIGRES